MTPIVCIVGKSKVGKTTLVERLVTELKRRRYRVATIKHDVHGFELDKPGKDSWRHAQAGSDAVVISSPQKLALIKKVESDPSLDEIARLLRGDFDIILAEGFKQSRAPKIEVHRRQVSEGLLCSPQELLAVATDEPLEITARQYPLDDASGIADLLEQRFLTPRQDEDTVLFANGSRVPLNPFARSIIGRTLLGMVSALKGVGEVRSLDMWIRTNPEGGDEEAR